jgi:hypothetical protein
MRRNRAAAHDDMMASLRHAAHVRSLVMRTTGLSPGDENFDTAIDYVHVNLKHHRFAEMGADGIACRPLYEDLIEKLERHAQHAKASALRGLCSELCTSRAGGVTAWEWSPRHKNVVDGISVLVALYWLSNTAHMVRTSAQPQLLHPNGTPSAVARIQAVVARERVEEAAIHAAWHSSEAAEMSSWGFSDEEEVAAEEEEGALGGGGGDGASSGGSDGGDTAAAEPREPLVDGLWGPVPEALRGQAQGRALATAATGGGTGGEPYSHRRAAPNLGLPPSHLQLALLGQAYRYGLVDGALDGNLNGRRASRGSKAEDGSDSAARASRLAQLRLLREAVRALMGCEGAHWHATGASSDGGGAGTRSGIGAGMGGLDTTGRAVLTESARAAWVLRAATAPPVPATPFNPLLLPSSAPATHSNGARLHFARDSDAGALLRLQPTATVRVLCVLEQLGARVLGVRAFATRLLERRARTPAVLRALAEALLDEIQPLHAQLWNVDADARRAQQHSGERRLARRADGPQPSLLSLTEDLRHGEAEAEGWMRRLRCLEILRHRLVKENAVAELLSEPGDAEGAAEGSAEGADGAAIAASHVLNTLLDLLQEEQLLGDMGGHDEGELAFYEAEQRDMSGSGGVGGGVGGVGGIGGVGGASVPPTTALPMWTRLLVASLVPYLAMWERWLSFGRLHDPTGELPIAAAADTSESETEAHWRHGFVLRSARAIPHVLRTLAPALLLAGKSRHLLLRMPHLGGEMRDLEREIAHVSPAGVPLDTAFCAALLQKLHWPMSTSTTSTSGFGTAPSIPIHTPIHSPIHTPIHSPLRPGRDGISAKGPSAFLGKDMCLLPTRPRGLIPAPTTPMTTTTGRHTERAVVLTSSDETRDGTRDGTRGFRVAVDARGAPHGAHDVEAAEPDDDVDDEKKEEEEEEEVVGTPFGMRGCTDARALPRAPPGRTHAERVRRARRSLCHIETSASAAEESSAGFHRLPQQASTGFHRLPQEASALRLLRDALGATALRLCAAPLPTAVSSPSGPSGPSVSSSARSTARSTAGSTADASGTAVPPSAGEWASSWASSVDRVLGLPPLAVLLEHCLLGPLRERCALPGPELLAAVAHATMPPLRVAQLLHRVLLFGEPRLTAPLLEGRLFPRLALHRAWRRQLPELHAALSDALLDAHLPPDTARCFSVEVASAAERHSERQPPSSDVTASPVSSTGLDALDVHALGELRLRFTARWPLPLAISHEALRTHERIGVWLLRLRRARWALETSESGRTSLRGSGPTGGWQCAHPWRVLRAQVLHLIASVYSHVVFSVLHSEWQLFVGAVSGAAGTLTDVDAFRGAHEAFAFRVEQRCLLGPSHAPLIAAIDRILGLALRLRLQLEELPRLAVKSHAASAARWRAELRTGVQFVLDELRRAAEREPARRAELADLRRLLDYNGFYGSAA